MKDEFVESVMVSPRDVQLDVPFMKRLLERWGHRRDPSPPREPSPANPAPAHGPWEPAGAR